MLRKPMRLLAVIMSLCLAFSTQGVTGALSAAPDTHTENNDNEPVEQNADDGDDSDSAAEPGDPAVPGGDDTDEPTDNPDGSDDPGVPDVSDGDDPETGDTDDTDDTDNADDPETPDDTVGPGDLGVLADTVGPDDGNTDDPDNTDGADYLPGKILLAFHDRNELSRAGFYSSLSESSVAHSFQTFSGEIESVSELGHGIQTIAVVDLPDGMSVEAAIAEYEQSPLLKFAQPVYIYHTLSAPRPNDPVLNNNWRTTGAPWPSHHDRIGTFEAWQILDDFERAPVDPVTVAVIDSQIDLTHPDLTETLLTDKAVNIQFRGGKAEYIPSLSSADFHGTHVAGLIGATANNGRGDAGVAAGRAKILPINVFEWSGSRFVAYTPCTTEGIYYAVREGARVINLSLGGSGSDHLMKAAIDHATNRGVVVVAAAGNSGDTSATYPSDYSNVISVINVMTNNHTGYAAPGPFVPWEIGVDPRHASSSYGASKNISAPGFLLWAPVPPGQETSGVNDFPGYAPLNGTSMASPVTAGIVALMIYADPTISRQNLTSILYDTATDVHTPGYDTMTGHGVVNAAKAVGDTLARSLPMASNLRARAHGPTAIRLTWQMPGGVSPTSFDIAPVVDGEVDYDQIINISRDSAAIDTGFAYNMGGLDFGSYRFALRPKYGTVTYAAWVLSGPAQPANPTVTNVRVELLNPFTIRLSFNAPTNTAGGNISKYTVWRTDDLNANRVNVGETGGLEFVDRGLSIGRNYSYTIQPMWDDGGRLTGGRESARVSQRTRVPAAPRLSATALGPTSMELRWNPLSAVSGYSITVVGQGEAHTVEGATANRFVANDLYPNTSYTFFIRPYWDYVDAADNKQRGLGTYGTALTARTGGGAAPVLSENVGEQTHSSVVLSFNEVSDPAGLASAFGYRINKDGKPFDYISAEKFATLGNKWTDVTLAPGVSARYTVQACWIPSAEPFGSGPGIHSNSVTVSIAGPAPVILAAPSGQTLYETAIPISWSAATGDFDTIHLAGYRIYVGQDVAGTSDNISTNPLATSASIVGLAPGTRYALRVVPLWNVGGERREGRPSAAANRRTAAGIKPAALGATARGIDVTLRWDAVGITPGSIDPGAGIHGYRISKNGSPYKYVSALEFSSLSGAWSDKHNNRPGTSIRYAVQACYGPADGTNPFGTRPGPAAQISARTVNPAPALRVSPMDAFRVQLNWPGIPGVDEYDLYRDGVWIATYDSMGNKIITGEQFSNPAAHDLAPGSALLDGVSDQPSGLSLTTGAAHESGAAIKEVTVAQLFSFSMEATTVEEQEALLTANQRPRHGLGLDMFAAPSLDGMSDTPTQISDAIPVRPGAKPNFRLVPYYDNELGWANWFAGRDVRRSIAVAGGTAPSGIKRRASTPTTPAVTPTSISFQWNALRGDNVPGAYYIYLSWTDTNGNFRSGFINRTWSSADNPCNLLVTGLDPGCAVSIQVSAVYSDNGVYKPGVKSKPVRIKTAGPAPRKLQAAMVAGSRTQAVLTWEPHNSSTTNPPASAYRISWRDSDGGTGSAVSPTTTYADNTLKPGISRRYQVRSLWSDSYYGGAGAAATRTLKPGGVAPGGVRTQAGPTSINVTWKAIGGTHANGLLGYYLYWRPSGTEAWKNVYISTGQNRQFTLTALSPASRYQIQMAGVWEQSPGSSSEHIGRKSAIRNVRTTGVAPKKLRVSSRGADRLQLTWSAVPDTNVSGYLITRTIGASGPSVETYITVEQYYKNQNGFTDTSPELTFGMEYRYNVRACWGSADIRGKPSPQVRARLAGRF